MGGRDLEPSDRLYTWLSLLLRPQDGHLSAAAGFTRVKGLSMTIAHDRSARKAAGRRAEGAGCFPVQGCQGGPSGSVLDGGQL